MAHPSPPHSPRRLSPSRLFPADATKRRVVIVSGLPAVGVNAVLCISQTNAWHERIFGFRPDGFTGLAFTVWLALIGVTLVVQYLTTLFGWHRDISLGRAVVCGLFGGFLGIACTLAVYYGVMYLF